MATKAFPLNDVLSITTERFLSDDIGKMYEILNWMTDDNLFTHQLPRAGRECRPWLLRWFPELEGANEHLPLLDKRLDECKSTRRPVSVGVTFWLSEVTAMLNLPCSYEVPRIPRDDHDKINPVDELVGMVGADRVIVVDASEQ